MSGSVWNPSGYINTVFASAINFLQRGVGAITRTVQAKLEEELSVLDFGAVGNGIVDDTLALNVAEAAAFTLGVGLSSPSGLVFNYNGFFSVRVNFNGNGSTIKQTRTAVSSNSSEGTLIVAVDGITVKNVKVDSALKCSGITGDGKSYVNVTNCHARNCVNLGIGFYGGTEVHIDKSSATNIRYNALGITAAADGFYLGGCVRCTWTRCKAEDFRRIGFVAEGNGATKSEQIVAKYCLATNSNNCDDSATEYNGGFWAENTNSVDWLYCTATNIAGNPGQTSGRIIGLWALGGGNNSQGVINVIGCKIFGGAGYMPAGINITGSGTFASVVVENCYISKARIGVQTGCGMNTLTLRGIYLNDIITTNASQGGVVVDSNVGISLNAIEIDTVVATNSTWHANTGGVNYFAAPAAAKYILRNLKGFLPHVMRSSVATLKVENCEIACGASSYSSFLATYQEHVDCTYTSRNSSGLDLITGASSLATGSEVIFRGGTITGFGAGWAPEFGGVGITLKCFDTKFVNFCWPISTTGTFINQFLGCQFTQVPVTIGAIRTNFNAPTKQVLIAQNNYFESANAADTPIRLWNTAPTNAILQGNTRRTATNLHNLGAVTSDVNNVVI